MRKRRSTEKEIGLAQQNQDFVSKRHCQKKRWGGWILFGREKKRGRDGGNWESKNLETKPLSIGKAQMTEKVSLSNTERSGTRGQRKRKVSPIRQKGKTRKVERVNVRGMEGRTRAL